MKERWHLRPNSDIEHSSTVFIFGFESSEHLLGRGLRQQEDPILTSQHAMVTKTYLTTDSLSFECKETKDTPNIFELSPTILIA